MKTIASILSLFALTINSYSQELLWTIYAEVNGVKIFTAETDCNANNIPDQKAILIRVENTTDFDIRIEWDQAIWYNGKLVTQNVTDGEHHMVVKLLKNSITEGTCDEPMGALYIYKDFITYQSDTKLTNFELQNITVCRL